MRYRNSSLIKGGKLLSTNQTIKVVRRLVSNGTVLTTRYISKENDRLDVIAGRIYGDASYWWIIAAASGIGWWLQVAPGTVLYIPTPIEQIEKLAERI